MSQETIIQLVLSVATVIVSVYGAHALADRQSRRERLSILFSEIYQHTNAVTRMLDQLCYDYEEKNDCTAIKAALEKEAIYLDQMIFRVELEIGEHGDAVIHWLGEIARSIRLLMIGPSKCESDANAIYEQDTQILTAMRRAYYKVCRVRKPQGYRDDLGQLI